MASHAVLSSVKGEKYVFADDSRMPVSMSVATEVPVSFVYGGLPYAVMMATPDNLEDFAYGFSLTEGVIKTAQDMRAVTIDATRETMNVAMTLASTSFQTHLAKRRMMSGRTSCGLCGVETVADLPVARRTDTIAPMIAAQAVHQALMALEEAQTLNRATRSLHAAAWCDLSGHITVLREDVGRHNALDKVIGHLLRNGIGSENGFFLITSRASFEMVEKAALFGARTVVAISAPTSLAIRRAEILGVRLLAIARPDSMIEFTPGIHHDGERQ